ncbi:protein FANTASTIC FOUR 1-like [Pyrus x bretschneideri]|uniref:protein FANTASTIC FOUR 1-like n=1 Tax=Pyrus x bretschneideri TaxID=225117 RepID=UPI00202E11CD|nr:protein FANTASTIC FOUR 1-like [Pyrus x bretschneideri]
MSSTSSTVCHPGLKSCLEPLVLLKLNPPGLNFLSQSQEKASQIEKIDNLNLNDKKDKKEVEVAGWSFLQSLVNPIQPSKSESEAEKVYVHPLAKRSASALSPGSLEMCTESLGNETGSENGGEKLSLLLHKIESPLLSLGSSGEVNPNPKCSTTTISTSESSKILSDTNVQATPKRLKRSSITTTNFPPPLTSISGSNGVQVTPHREGGRLVLKAVTVVSPPTAYFQAERGDGRLRLTLLKPNCDIIEEVEEDDEVQIEAKNEEIGGEVEEDELDGKVENVETEEMQGDIESAETEEVEGKNEHCVENEDMEGKNGNAGVGKEKKKRPPRPSRCKEGGRGNNKMVINWPESFWVAI